jgi:hypothetical protein
MILIISPIDLSLAIPSPTVVTPLPFGTVYTHYPLFSTLASPASHVLITSALVSKST